MNTFREYIVVLDLLQQIKLGQKHKTKYSTIQKQESSSKFYLPFARFIFSLDRESIPTHAVVNLGSGSGGSGGDGGSSSGCLLLGGRGVGGSRGDGLLLRSVELGRGLSVSSGLTRSDTNHVGVDGTRHTVLGLDVDLGQVVL